MADDIQDQALRYHEFPRPGKIQVTPSKPLANQRDLALAYSPGVASACHAIVTDPRNAARYTARGNLVAVVSNGTAVLGLGAIGPLAAKPVMEGKGVLFKKFAGIDVFDIEIDERDPDKLVEIIASLEPTFGGINLEDIKAPECFVVEQKLRERMNIPVFHDDQHGTAIIAAAAILNGLRVVGKHLGKVRLVANGAGAAGIACLDLLVGLGLPRERITVCDSHGVIYAGRDEPMESRKARYAADTLHRTLAEAMVGADIFLGVSGPGLVSQDMVASMAPQPLILALANPIPEIMPELAREARPDALIATGRSDYPNQVNNVLCFPYMFRGALDVAATTINEAMKLAAVQALADLAMIPPSDEVAAAYAGQNLRFGPEYLIPKPFDARLMQTLPMAVAKAAMDSGVATRPIKDFRAYQEQLNRQVFRSGLAMKPVIETARAKPQRVLYAEGEEARVLRAVQVVLEEGIAEPVVIGRRQQVEAQIEELSLRIHPDRDFELIEPTNHAYYEACWRCYHQLRERHGIDPADAQLRITTRATVLAATLLRLGHVDGMLCGVRGTYQNHLDYVTEILGPQDSNHTMAALNLLLTPMGSLFIGDTQVNENPSPQQIADITLMAADTVSRFGITPKVALLSHANFGSRPSAEAQRMAEALPLIRARAPDLEVEGEMHGDAALVADIRQHIFPNSRLQGAANLLIMPNLGAAHIAFSLLKIAASEGVTVGPIMLGLDWPAHVLNKTSMVRQIVNMSAIAAVDAQGRAAARTPGHGTFLSD